MRQLCPKVLLRNAISVCNSSTKCFVKQKSLAIAEGPRDKLSQLKTCQLCIELYEKAHSRRLAMGE